MCYYSGENTNHNIWNQHQHTVKKLCVLVQGRFSISYFPSSFILTCILTRKGIFYFWVQKHFELRMEIHSSARDSGQWHNSALKSHGDPLQDECDNSGVSMGWSTKWES